MQAANRFIQSRNITSGQEIIVEFSTVPNKLVRRQLEAVDPETLGPTN